MRYCSHDCYMRSRAETTPERIVRETLAELEIPFDAQVRVGRWTVDFLLRSLVIEVDGDYWHDKPEVVAKDRRKDRWLQNNGYEVFRIRESELGPDLRDVIRKRWGAFARSAGVDPGPHAL